MTTDERLDRLTLIVESQSAAWTRFAESQAAALAKFVESQAAAAAKYEDRFTVEAVRGNRHEQRLKDHQEWLEDVELSFARMAGEHARLDDIMTKLAAAHLLTEEALRQLEIKIDNWLEARGSNGHGS